MFLRGARRGIAADLEELEDIAEGMALPEGVVAIHDVAYGPHPQQRLDVYRTANGTANPIILMIHGGAWMAGDKRGRRVVMNKVSHWVPRGYLFVSINYRLFPQARPLEQARDVATALAFTQQHAAGWGGDASRLLALGHSSGAHLLALLTSDPKLAAAAGARGWRGTVLLDSACLDVVAIMRSPHRPLYDRVFGNRQEDWREVSPLHRLGQQETVPLMIVCSTLREDSCEQAQAFAAQVRSRGGRAEVLPMPFSHAEINGELGSDLAYTDSVDTFVRSLGLP